MKPTTPQLKYRVTICIFSIICFQSMGCAKLGPTTLKSERSSYNLAVQRTNDEQLLLNLTRLKYRDTPFFMEVSSVASQFTLSGTANASASLQEGVNGLFGLAAVWASPKDPRSLIPLCREINSFNAYCLHCHYKRSPCFFIRAGASRGFSGFAFKE